MKLAALGLAFLATLVVGVVLGGMLVGKEVPPDSTDDSSLNALRRENEDLLGQLATGDRSRDEAPEAAARDPRSIADGAGAIRPAPGGEFDDEPVAMDGPFPSLEGVENASQLSALLMRFVDQQLSRGPEGYKTLLRALGGAASQLKSMERFFRDESALTRELYPWIRFLVAREDQVLDVSEFFYKTMAEDPAFFEGLEDDPFEVFTEGVAVMLPGVVPPDRLESFRGYARTILAMPEESLPDAIRKNRGDIERALNRLWIEPMTTEEALEKLTAGGLDSGQALRLLKSLPPEKLQSVDVTGLLAPVLAAGSYDAIRVLSSLPSVPLDVSRLDASVLEGMRSGANQGWFVSRYLNATGRTEWVKARPFIESALVSSEKARNSAAEAIMRLSGTVRPEPDYVRDLLSRYELAEHLRNGLRSRYGLK